MYINMLHLKFKNKQKTVNFNEMRTFAGMLSKKLMESNRLSRSKAISPEVMSPEDRVKSPKYAALCRPKERVYVIYLFL